MQHDIEGGDVVAGVKLHVEAGASLHFGGTGALRGLGEESSLSELAGVEASHAVAALAVAGGGGDGADEVGKGDGGRVRPRDRGGRAVGIGDGAGEGDAGGEDEVGGFGPVGDGTPRILLAEFRGAGTDDNH